MNWIKIIIFAAVTTALFCVPIWASVHLVHEFFGDDALWVAFPFYLLFWTVFFVFKYFDKFINYLIKKFKIIEGEKE